MYLKKEEATKLLEDFKIDLKGEVLQHINFLSKLLSDDDWSMIIKSQSLIESLITELLIAKTEEPKLKNLIERLPLADEQMGKLRIVKDYELLSSSERSFVKKFSELRNNLVHKFENIDFDLKEWVDGLDKNQKKSWQKAITWYEDGKNMENNLEYDSYSILSHFNLPIHPYCLRLL